VRKGPLRNKVEREKTGGQSGGLGTVCVAPHEGVDASNIFQRPTVGGEDAA